MLVPIKVKIGLSNNGSADYPNFNLLPSVQSSGLDWSKYIDVRGSGWLYDTIGHKEEDTDSPRGMQWGMILVPEQFAIEAVAQFPNEVSVIDEVEAEDFYNNRHAVGQPDEEIDNEVLTGIKLKKDLGLALTQQQQNALDPNKPERGIRKNETKTYAGLKAKRGFQVKPNITSTKARKTWSRAL